MGGPHQAGNADGWLTYGQACGKAGQVRDWAGKGQDRKGPTDTGFSSVAYKTP